MSQTDHAAQVAERGIIHRAESEGVFDLDRLDAGPVLSPFIEHFWCVSWDRTGFEPVVTRTIPFPTVSLTVETGDPGEVRHGHRMPATLLHGVTVRTFEVSLSGCGWVVGAKFRPGGWWAWSGLDAGVITDQAILAQTIPELDDVTRRQEAVLAAGDVHERRDILIVALETRAPEPDDDYLRLTSLVDQMRQDSSLTRVEQLPEIAGWSLRTIQRYFRRRVGVPAKWVLQRFRIQEAALLLERDPETDLADLSAALGWHDQAHFTRDFRQTLGTTPARYAAHADVDPHR